MGSALTTYVPLFAFMLIPLWIPIIAVVVGALLDRVGGTRPSATVRAVRDAKLRTLRPVTEV